MREVLLTLAASDAPGDIGWTGLRIFAAVALVIFLALIATSRRFFRLQRNRNIAGLLAGGWPAIAIGFFLGPHGAHIISGDTLLEVRPLLIIGLGWIGFLVGMQARKEILAAAPRNLWYWVSLDAVVSLALTGCIAWMLLQRLVPHGRETVIWMLLPVLVLGACALGWSPETRSLLVRHSEPTRRLAVLIRAGSGLSAIFAIAIFGLIYKLAGRTVTGDVAFTPIRLAIAVAASLGIATLVGLGARFMLHQAGRSRPDLLVVFIGVVAIVAGTAVDLTAAPLFTAMLTGVVVANLAGPALRDFERFIAQAEQPVALMFWLLAGVLLETELGAWLWALVAALVSFRVLVKPLLMRATLRDAVRHLPSDSPLRAAPIRQSPIAVALAVALVLAEASAFHRMLLTLVVLVGLLSDLVPMLFAATRRRFVHGRSSGPIVGNHDPDTIATRQFTHGPNSGDARC